MPTELLMIIAAVAGDQPQGSTRLIQNYNPPEMVIASEARGWQIEVRSGWERRAGATPTTLYEARLIERGATVAEGVTDTNACPALVALIDDVRRLEAPVVDLPEVGGVVTRPDDPPPADGHWTSIEVRALRGDGRYERLLIRSRTGPVWTLAREAYGRLEPCWTGRPPPVPY